MNWVSYNSNVSDLLDQVPQEEQRDSIYADGAYDTKHCWQVILPKKMRNFGKIQEQALLNEMNCLKQ